MRFPRSRRATGYRLGALSIALLGIAAPLLGPSTASAASTAPSPAPSSQGARQSKGAPPPAVNLTYGVKPIQPDGSKPRGAFAYDLPPQSRAQDVVSLFNYSTVPLTFELYAADAFTNEQGDYSVENNEVKPTGAGAWVHFLLPAGSLLKIPARSRVDVPVAFVIPQGATPGDHFAGIVMSLPASTRDASGNVIRVDSRVSAQVKIRVLGALRSELTLENVSAQYHGVLSPVTPGTATVSYTVHNTGNIALAGAQHIAVNGPFGLGAQGVDMELPIILPGSSVNVTVPLAHVWPLLRYTATVEVIPQGREGDPTTQNQTADAAFWALPWSWLALAALALLLGYATWRRWRRRIEEPRRGGRHNVPAPARTDDSEVLVP